MKEIQKSKLNQIDIPEVSLEDGLEIFEDLLRKNYLSRLSGMEVAQIDELLPIQQDLIENVRLYKITEMVYQKGENATDKFTTVFNTLASYPASVFLVLDSDGKTTDFYLGVRNCEKVESAKRSTVTLGDTLKQTIIGQFPGVKIEGEDRFQTEALSEKIHKQKNVTTVSVIANSKSQKDQSNEQFVQGLEKLALAMQGRQYIGIIIAENKTPFEIQMMRRNYQNLYSNLTPYQKIQTTTNETRSTSRSQSFAEMNAKQKAVMIGNALATIGGMVVGGAMGNKIDGVELVGGAMVGGQIAGQLGGLLNSLAPVEQISDSHSESNTVTQENKTVTDLLELIDQAIKKTHEYDSYGMWNVAGYFLSNDMTEAEVAASNYRSLMNGEQSGREVSAINSWREEQGDNSYETLTTYLSRFAHPKFVYGSENGCVSTYATTQISGKELGIHLGLPRATVPGLPVIEHAEFGKEVSTYSLFEDKEEKKSEETIELGKVFDLGRVTDRKVKLDNKSLNMHTFITGSTGSGKSNTVYQMLNELHQDGVPFLVIEPAKGEYKDVFGNLDDVNVFSTNPKVAPLIKLNPFKFPESIHVLEHVDGLVEIFSVCWPMYDAMPAFFKDAILKSYEDVGWDLGSSTFDGDEVEYPDFEVLVEKLNELIEASDYASDIKSNYRGALITRVKSLTVGLNKYMFTAEQTPYEELFDQNCILDISRVKSNETKALLMGLMVYILNEYRVEQKEGSNRGLKHVTVLEEAHNLLKNTNAGSSELVGKSVEMLTQTIAEIRTYGEGFIIVDQSPSSVDIAAIKNTNTKIVLRTPEANDRNAVGRSMGLDENQINEIAKLPSGVAVVYQNDWISPVLALIDKADVDEEMYVYKSFAKIKPVKRAREELVCMLMSPWIVRERIAGKSLSESIRTIDLDRSVKAKIESCVDDYIMCGGTLVWGEDNLIELGELVRSILGVSKRQLEVYAKNRRKDELAKDIQKKLKNFSLEEIREVCRVMLQIEEE